MSRFSKEKPFPKLLKSVYFRKEKKVLEVANNCVSCRICEKRCPVGISPYEYKGDVLSHPDCIQCARCVLACPKESIEYNNKEKVKAQNKIEQIV